MKYNYTTNKPNTCHISRSQSELDPGPNSHLNVITGEHNVSGVSGYASSVMYLVDNFN